MNEKRYGRRFRKGFLLFLARKAEERTQKLRSVQAQLSFLHKKAHREALRNFPMCELRKNVFLPDKVGHGPLGVLRVLKTGGFSGFDAVQQPGHVTA